MFDEASIKLLETGSVGVIPTDTVYGLVARAGDEAAVKKLYALKGREAKPAPIIAASIDQLVSLGIKRRYLKPIEQYWPGPISVIVPHGLGYLSQGLGAQPMRIPDNKKLLKLLSKTGPLVATSANKPGEAVANNIQEARAYFGEQVDFYVDGGDLSNRPSSTIIRIVDDAIEIIREGEVKINDNGKIG